MKHYETVFILTPVLSDDQVKETVVKFKGIIEKAGAKIDNQENWGLKKLAYPIQKKSTGFYHLMEFSTEDGSILADIEVAFKREEKVIRFLTTSLDKHALAWARVREERAKRAINRVVCTILSTIATLMHRYALLDSRY